MASLTAAGPDQYLVAALQTLAPTLGAGVMGVLQAPQPPPAETMLTALLNEISAVPDAFILVLDDYHVMEAKPVDQALTFLLEHLPPQMRLVITTREDPQLPLARLRVRDQMTELRATDLRFTPAEAAGFLSEHCHFDKSIELESWWNDAHFEWLKNKLNITKYFIMYDKNIILHLILERCWISYYLFYSFK